MGDTFSFWEALRPLFWIRWVKMVLGVLLCCTAQSQSVGSALQTRLETLYGAPTPPPPVAPTCTPVPSTGVDVAFWLQKVGEQRKTGGLSCALQMLQRLEPFAKGQENDREAWLAELSHTLRTAEYLDSAIVVAQELTALAERRKHAEGYAWFVEAQAHHAKRKFSETYRLAEKSLDWARTHNDKTLMIRALTTIGDVSRDLYMTRPDKSVAPLMEALNLARTIRDTALIAQELLTLGLHYLENDMDRTVSFLEQAAATEHLGHDPRNRVLMLRLLSYCFQMTHDFNRSNKVFERAVVWSKHLGLRSNVQNDYEQMSGNYMELGNADMAQVCLDSAYRYCNFQRELGYFYKNFAEVAVMRGDMPNAVQWYERAFQEQVKGYNARNTEQLTEWETRFRTREIKMRAEQQQKQRYLWAGLALLLAFLLAGTAIAFLQQRKIRRQLAAQKEVIEQQAVELRRLDEAKSRFFANISHELRTPLTLITGPLATLLKSAYLNTRDLALAQTAQQHTQYLLRLINEILDLSKLESGKMQLNEVAVSFQPFIRRVASSFESHAERLGIRFVFEYTINERLLLMIDEDKIEKIINNLLANALKFTPPNGSITVKVEATASKVCLSVADTGKGIYPEDLPHVFDRFYQSGQPGVPMGGGTGIGLALCREFAEVMAGRIWAESTLGKGSCFYVEFPKKEVLGTERGIAPTATADVPSVLYGGTPDRLTLPSGAFPTILLVEDNDSLRQYVKVILERQYRVEEAQHGQQALEHLLAHPKKLPHLIISDVMMPVMDGFQLVENLKADDRYRHLPVVMLTARADLRDKIKALRIGVDDYLLKPFEEEELLVRVGNLLRNLQNRPDMSGASTDDEVVAEVAPVDADALEWLAQLEKTVGKAVKDDTLGVDSLAEAMYMSRTKFFQEVKRLTGMTPNEYILAVRFDKARAILESKQAQSVKAVAATVGFRDVEYFSKQFKSRFGRSPSEYLN